jgi:hypothetical protein
MMLSFSLSLSLNLPVSIGTSSDEDTGRVVLWILSIEDQGTAKVQQQEEVKITMGQYVIQKYIIDVI